MRAALITLVVLLLPAALLATPTMGVYFTWTPVQMTYSPTPYEEFTGYVYLQNTECYVTAAEFRIDPPAGIMLASFEIPPGSLNLGDPESGIAITYWPPLNGYYPGYNLLCTIGFVAMKWCVGGGGGGATLQDAPVIILPHPETGRISTTCWPENMIFDVNPMTSIICPSQIGVHEKSWGAIKSLYE